MLAALVSNPVPVIVSVVALLGKLAELEFTVGSKTATVVKPPKGLVQPEVPAR